MAKNNREHAGTPAHAGVCRYIDPRVGVKTSFSRAASDASASSSTPLGSRGRVFFSSRRRHTRYWRDWSSDVCSSDLPRLALAIAKAREASMPKDNIERAIAKGTGAGADADALETVVYEGYGPGGVALLIEAVTDNRNRTGSEVRHLFNKHAGNLGEPGSVADLFDKRWLVVVDADRYSEDDLMPAIDAGAEDIARDEDVYEILSEPGDLPAVRDALAEAGVEVENAEI